MFYDFSSAFNTIQPHLLVQKMMNMNIPKTLVQWIFNYLTHRSQFVKLPVCTHEKSETSYVVSDTLYTNTGAPQGTVLSPFLFTLYTADSRQTHASCPLVKFADDTSQVGKIKNNDDRVYRNEVQDFVEWCDKNYLHLNEKKTREMIIDFTQSAKETPDPVLIKGTEVERVDVHKYLGVIFDNRLSFRQNSDTILKKVQSRMYCLSKLKSFSVNSNILQSFYSSAVKSVLMYGAVCWGGNLLKQDKCRMDKVIKKASIITGKTNRPFSEEYEERVFTKSKNILSDKKHPLNNDFYNRQNKKSKRFRPPILRTDRYRLSFLPRALNLLNDKKVERQ